MKRAYEEAPIHGVNDQVPDPLDVKFLGVVKEYNDQKGFGMIECHETQIMWNVDVYAYKDVLAAANCGVGDTIRFGVHLNPRGQPQASLPVWKVAEDGICVGLDPEATFICAEEQDPNSLEDLKETVAASSERQNRKRAKGQDKGKGKAKDKGHHEWRGPPRAPQNGWAQAEPQPRWDAAPQWDGGKGGPQQQHYGQATLYVAGLPLGASRRELLHIFRQYAGFTELRQIERQDHAICFATFETQEQGQFVLEALTGYIFDQDAPDPHAYTLTVQFAKTLKRKP